MNGYKSHTALLENLFGPIRLHILKQENEFRIVHLYDDKNVSRTLGVVRFRNFEAPSIKEIHNRIVAGELLGKTLIESRIPYNKSYISTISVHLPEWLKKDFQTTQTTSPAIYSHITLGDLDSNTAFLYAELFEIIPPDIIHLIPHTNFNSKIIDEEMMTLLGYADITAAPIDKKL